MAHLHSIEIFNGNDTQRWSTCILLGIHEHSFWECKRVIYLFIHVRCNVVSAYYTGRHIDHSDGICIVCAENHWLISVIDNDSESWQHSCCTTNSSIST